jgi:phenylpyruvate tautomerase PptA (4-oxalocrotonate tautomerase family)
MPLARISVPTHLSLKQVQVIADAVHNGLVETCNVPMDDRFQLITRFSPELMILNPTFGNVNRSSAASIVEITFLGGRTDQQKQNLYKHIVSGCSASGMREDDIMIALTENHPIDWSLGRGESFTKHN